MSDTSDPDSEEYDSDEMEDGVGVAATVIAPTDVKATIEELRRKQLSDAKQVASVELAAKKARAAAAEAAAARFEAASRAAAELARNPPPIVQGVSVTYAKPRSGKKHFLFCRSEDAPPRL